MDDQKTKKPFWRYWLQFSNYLLEEFLGGPKILKLAWLVNFQKAGTFFYVLLLMNIYNNYSLEAYIYLALHGMYGFCWLIKHFVFPDKQWEKKITIGGAFIVFLLVLGPYWIFPFLLISDILGIEKRLISLLILSLAISIHTLGLVIMIIADCQKYFTLKYHKGLIRDGIFKYIRHPNYLGEMMLYGSYALIVQHWIPWAILFWIWIGVFWVNILNKEASLSRYPQWKDYKNKTGMLFPKLY